MEWLQALWPFMKHAGAASGTIVALLAAAFFVPTFRRDLTWAAVAVAALLFAYSLGVKDEHAAGVLRAQIAEKQVREAVERAMKDTRKDPWDDPSL